jgi:hypothetical protein
MGYKYFKVYGGSNLKINSQYGFNFLQFESDKRYEYIDFIGSLKVQDLKLKTNDLITLPINTEQIDNPSKLTSKCQQSKELKDDFLLNNYCYFPSDRYEIPYWLNTEIPIQNERFNESEKFFNKLDKEILIRKSMSDIKSWILDVFLDSRVDIIKITEESGETSYNTKQHLPTIELLKISVENINVLISKILGSNVELEVNFRGRGNSRLKLIDKITRRDVLPSLNNLSAGQSTLLSIFANIIKASDVSDLNKSINLNQISGIVVIDEIDLHLHIELQKEILPKLIKLLPKVQFIITSHSPFFLNGMAKTFDQDDYIVVNMPSGKILNAYDEFEEFNKAYEIFEGLTNDYKKERDLLKVEIAKSIKPIIITEGKTDWKHLKKALERFKKEGFYNDLDIEFLEYEENIKMGDSSLDSMVEALKKTHQNKKTIFIFDRDNEIYIKKYANEEFNNHSNNVYSFCIPKIDETLDKISLEFYYKDKDLKTVDENNRRLFIGNEFYTTTNSKCGIYQTEKKDKCDKLVIIDEKVYKNNDLEHKYSLALTKNSFAENILKDVDGFNNFDIEYFKKIFEVLEKIIDEN